MRRPILEATVATFSLCATIEAQGTPQTYFACYVPVVGAVYMIKLPGLPTNCVASSHQELSWKEGAGGPAGGDLSGTFPNPMVSGLRGRELSALAPTSGQVLSFDGERWVPLTPNVAGVAGGDLSGAYPNPTVSRLQGRVLATTPPVNGQVLIYDAPSGSWKPGTPPSGVTVHGQLSGLTADDHTQYLLAAGSRALTGSLNAGGNKVTNLGAGTAPGDAVRFEQVIKSSDPATGDLAGTYPSPVVARLQGRSVSSTAPANGQTLAFDASTNSWRPTTPASGVSVHAQLSGLAADDHTQYLLVSGARALSGSLSVSGHKVTGLGAATSAGDAVRYEQALKAGDVAAGDLSGAYPSPTVARLQGVPVSASPPGVGHVLTYGAGGWSPASLPGLSIQTTSVQTPIPAGPPFIISASVPCPLGTVALSAGWDTFNSGNVILKASRRRADGSGWEFEWWNANGSALNPVTSTVYCTA